MISQKDCSNSFEEQHSSLAVQRGLNSEVAVVIVVDADVVKLGS